MKRMMMVASALAALAACDAPPAEPRALERAPAAVAPPLPSGPPLGAAQPDRIPAPAAAAAGWESRVFEDGLMLRIPGSGEDGGFSMTCSGRPRQLSVAIPSFTPIGSEDRLALELGSEPVTVVADLGSKAQGVTAAAPLPENLGGLLEGAAHIGALYGTQQSGPHPPPSKAQIEAFQKACAEPRV
jgi:hypothetical protein